MFSEFHHAIWKMPNFYWTPICAIKIQMMHFWKSQIPDLENAIFSVWSNKIKNFHFDSYVLLQISERNERLNFSYFVKSLALRSIIKNPIFQFCLIFSPEIFGSKVIIFNSEMFF